MTLGDFLKTKRIEKGYTQKQLAELIKSNNWQNIQKYEKNICEPTLKNTFLLCKILDININQIKDILENEQ